MEEVNHPPWEVAFWKNFFTKKRPPPNGSSPIHSSVHIKNHATLQLKNVFINNYTISGELPLDEFHCAHLGGKDVVIHKGKETYMANFKGRNVDGFGKIISQQLIYEGYIRNGEKCGQGKSTFFFLPSDDNTQSSVVIYKGEWKGNKRNGYGVLFIRENVNQPSVKRYEGWWRQNERHLYGVQWYSNAVYCGFWMKNRKCGFGKMWWFVKGRNRKGKERKSGSWKGESYEPCKDMTSGRSPLQKTNRTKKVIQNIYVGEWQNDEMHGYGTYFWFVRQGNRKNTPYQNERYNKYEGYWKRGKINGFGIFHHTCGDTYWGYWKDNKKHGQGYLLKINGTIYKCNYLNGEFTAQVQLNQTYVMNHLYTNSICQVINLGILLHENSNLTDSDIKYLYKIVYDHFDLLIKVYGLYWRKGWKEKRIGRGKRRDNKSIDKEEIVHSPLGSFKLKNLWHMFYDANIIHSSLPLSSLNMLVKDDMSIGEHINLASLLCDNYNWVDEDTPLNEEQMVKNFIQFGRPLAENFLFERRKEGHRMKTTNQGNHNPNINQVNLGGGIRLDVSSSRMNGQSCEEYNALGVAIHPVSREPYETQNPMAYILFNRNLFLVKGFAKFYKNQWKNQRCYHMKEAKIILKKIYFFLFTNKSRHENGYLFYVLFSVFHSSFPMWYALARMSRAWAVGRTGVRKGNGNSGNNGSVDLCGDTRWCAHLNKHLALLNLGRYNIHDERRKISFNSFVYTLVRVSLYLRDHRGEHHTHIMLSLLNELKRCVSKMDGQKLHPQSGHIKGGLLKGKRRTKRSRSNQVGCKRPLNKCEKKGEEEKWAVNGKKAITENRGNVVCPKKYTHLALCQGLPPHRDGERRQRGGNFHKKKKKEKVKKVKNSAKKVKALPSCAICCHRGAPPIKSNEKKKKKGSTSSGKTYHTALVNILDNFVYYFILYYLLFNSREECFSLLSAKLNVSLRLGDVLKFLLKLKLTRKDDTTGRESKSINLSPHHHYDDYRSLGRGRKKIKVKKWKPLYILNCADKREEKEGTTLPQRQTNNNHSNEEKHIMSTAKRNSYIAHTASHLQYMRKKKKKKKKSQFHLNRPGKNDRRKKKVLKKFSRMFCLSFVQVLAILAKTLNTPNLHLTNESNLQLCPSRGNEREKINKHRLQNNAVRYIVLLNEEKKKILNKFVTCEKRKGYSEELLSNRKNGETKEESTCPVHTKGYKNKLLKELSEQVKQLEVENLEQVANDLPPCVQLENGKKRNKKGGRTDEKKGTKRIHTNVEESPLVMSHEGGNAHVRIKLKSQVGVELHRLRKRFAHSRKNYMNVLDYYNTCITPYELSLFFLRFVRAVKRKRGINSSYSDVLFFFVFHVLLHRTFRLARQAGAHP
ncbi:conserved Plasmodium protein, unknown function [Plasmodium knowlesi strain H]|uniref:MORN repeat protein n=3 Tax=Plasmodium knowlesi TaxID=5850 RepID=A0A5K1VKP0_PLAKH|nr:MORN repeat protein, putative [Plasmodium knowlesi strain H]OTN67001.1 Uncharacterized protein PKNOH_S07456400 [Plasmodium knowlesi]CAA9988690.1 MORN repeat protein, putative [Plasmodium knowlesi strain H]SBO21609.1 conserved Plasmodium protein, unknown function [Plasmodium knowlesi strain H]VVS78164.1 MORN repeat protein, putative [Plasmodium knowlesi strain H]|eukprot:XP_002259667.1 hypothetical protein, conserved in Plasmodium species [Plasmodium knowlesi strain H]